MSAVVCRYSSSVPPSSLILLGNKVLPSLTAAVPLWSRVDLLSLLNASRTASDSQPLFMDLTRVRVRRSVPYPPIAISAQMKVAWPRCTACTSSTKASRDCCEGHSRHIYGCFLHV